jgi:hypothetical protein
MKYLILSMMCILSGLKAQAKDVATSIAIYPAGEMVNYDREKLTQHFNGYGFNVLKDVEVTSESPNQLIWRSSCESQDVGCLDKMRSQVAIAALLLARAGTPIKSIIQQNEVSPKDMYLAKYNEQNANYKDLIQLIANPSLVSSEPMTVEEMISYGHLK